MFCYRYTSILTACLLAMLVLFDGTLPVSAQKNSSQTDLPSVIPYSEYEQTIKPGQARLLELEPDKEYHYDIDHDNTLESINFTRTKTYKKDGTTEIEGYVDGKKEMILEGYYTAVPYIFTDDSYGVLLYKSVHGDGGTDWYAFLPEEKKYKETGIPLGGAFRPGIEVSDDTLILTSEPKGYWWYGSFAEYNNSDDVLFRTMSFYCLRDGVFCSIGSHQVPEGTVRCTAMGDFSTSKSISGLDLSDGPGIKKGDTVILKHLSYRSGSRSWEIEKDGERGWFPDSEENPLRVDEIK